MTRQLGLRMDTVPSSDRLVRNGNIDSTICTCQSESEAQSGASSCALFLEVLKTQTHGCGVSVGMAPSFSYPFAVS